MRDELREKDSLKRRFDQLYNSAHLESDLPIPPLSTVSILKCAELMVAKSVMAIPEALALTLSFSTTA